MTDLSWLDAIEVDHVDEGCGCGPDCTSGWCQECGDEYPCAAIRLVKALRDAQDEIDRLTAKLAVLEAGQPLVSEALRDEIQRLSVYERTVDRLLAHLDKGEKGWRGLVNTMAHQVPSVTAYDIRDVLEQETK